MSVTRVAIPTLVRVKPTAIDRMGIYLRRFEHRRVALMTSEGLPVEIVRRLTDALASESIERIGPVEIVDNDFGQAISLFKGLSSAATAIVGLGGGKALDVAKYVAFLAKKRSRHRCRWFVVRKIIYCRDHRRQRSPTGYSSRFR